MGARLSRGADRGRWLAGAVLVVGLVLTAIATRYVQRTIEQAASTRFSIEAEDTVQAIAKRMEAYVATIRSGAALFAASEEVTRQEFRHFVETLDLPTNYPGIQGLGFARVISPSESVEVPPEVAPFAERAPAPEGGTAIVMLEPQTARNLRALGFDMFSEPVRRQAMARARDTGQPAATGRVSLVQEIEPNGQPGFLIYVPVYRGADVPDTVEERRQQLEGWVYSPFRTGDLLQGIFGSQLVLGLEIYASAEPEEASLLFRSVSAQPHNDMREVRLLDVAGQPWSLVLQGSDPEAAGNALPQVVLVTSALITLLLFGITWSQVQGREAAEEASARLLASEAERSRLLEAERAARLETERERQRFAFLAEASELLASSLDPPDLLERIARRAVPFLGDGCAIDLWDATGQLHRQVLVYADEALQQALRAAYENQPLDRAFAPTVRHVAETGEPALWPEVPASFIEERVPPQLQEAAKRVLGSFLAVPLISREGILGIISFSSEQPLRYGLADQELATDLARRVALALDNARLFAGSQEAVRVRDDFLSIASHELRTPLTALQAHLQGLLRGVRRSDELDRQQLELRLETALRQTRRLGKLVNELLDVSRITAGKLHLEREALSLGELAIELVERLDEEAERAGCELRLEVAADTEGVWDRNRIEQVLTNLLANALKYGAGKPVEIRVDDEGEQVSVTVRDRGIGVPPEAIARIFGRFERAASERHYGGLGLGLYITRQIVEAHGGQIEVQSERGTGSSFRVVLPRKIPGP